MILRPFDTELNLCEELMNLSRKIIRERTRNPFYRFLKKFEPYAILGIGGFGCVFEAKKKLHQHNYAVKRIPLKGKFVGMENIPEFSVY